MSTLLPISWRFTHNYHRCKDLVEAADGLMNRSIAGDSLPDDLRRAAVLLAHATLEDLIRSLAEVRLPLADAKHLKTIPLLVEEETTRGPRYDLSDLAFYREQPVGEVIQRSVIAHLAGVTYNSIGQLALALDQIGLPRNLLEGYGGEFAAMMTRRHHIAHRADRNEENGGGDPMFRAIESDTVQGWIEAVFRFGDSVIGALSTSSISIDPGRDT